MRLTPNIFVTIDVYGFPAITWLAPYGREHAWDPSTQLWHPRDSYWPQNKRQEVLYYWSLSDFHLTKLTISYSIIIIWWRVVGEEGRLLDLSNPQNICHCLERSPSGNRDCSISGAHFGLIRVMAEAEWPTWASPFEWLGLLYRAIFWTISRSRWVFLKQRFDLWSLRVGPHDALIWEVYS